MTDYESGFGTNVYGPGFGHLGYGAIPANPAPTPSGAPQGTTIGAVGNGAPPVTIPQNNGVFGPSVGIGANQGGANWSGGGGPGSSSPVPGNGSSGGGAPGLGPTGLPTSPAGQTNTIGTGNPAMNMTAGQVGQYGSFVTPSQAAQAAHETWSITNAPEYSDYQQQETNADTAMGMGSQYLGAANPSIQAQQAQAQGQSIAQGKAAGNLEQLASGSSAAQQRNDAATNLLGQAAQGNGPTAAGMLQQQGIEQSIQAQQAQANSARGNFGLANAQKNAQATGAQMAQTGVQNAAMLRAQEMQAAQNAYAQQTNAAAQTQAGAAGAQGSVANAAYQGQATALNQAAGNQLTQANQGQNYYNQMANLYAGQGNTAANLASNQVANNYGLSGTQLQTSTQQNIANQNNQTQEIGAGLAAMGSLAAIAASDERVKTDIEPASEDIEHFLGAIGQHTYRYKDPTSPGQREGCFTSPMAQELEKTKLGQGLVIDTPHGKMVDYPRSLGLVLSGLANLNERLEKVRASR